MTFLDFVPKSMRYDVLSFCPRNSAILKYRDLITIKACVYIYMSTYCSFFQVSGCFDYDSIVEQFDIRQHQVCSFSRFLCLFKLFLIKMTKIKIPNTEAIQYNTHPIKFIIEVKYLLLLFKVCIMIFIYLYFKKSLKQKRYEMKSIYQ